MSNESTGQRYLKLAFQLNPMWQASELVDLRARALRLQRLDKKTNENEGDITALRQAAREQIAKIQAEFWKLHLESLKRHLEFIDVRRLPELAPVVGRLRTAAACRGEFPKLSQEPWMDLNLFTAFKTAVVLPPAEAGYVRESFLARIADPKQLKRIKVAVSRLQAEYPILYALEHDWFQTLAKHKIRKAASEGGTNEVSFSLPEMGWPMWLVDTRPDTSDLDGRGQLRWQTGHCCLRIHWLSLSFLPTLPARISSGLMES